jgi:hypothetical protein
MGWRQWGPNSNDHHRHFMHLSTIFQSVMIVDNNNNVDYPIVNIYLSWLVVLTILKHISQWEGWHPIYYGKNNVWNHQPVCHLNMFFPNQDAWTPPSFGGVNSPLLDKQGLVDVTRDVSWGFQVKKGESPPIKKVEQIPKVNHHQNIYIKYTHIYINLLG